VQLGQLPRDHHRPVAQHLFDGLQRFENPVRRLVKNRGRRFFGDGFERLNPLPGFVRQKAAEAERIGGQPRRGERRQRGRRSRQRSDGRALLDGSAHEAVARVGDQRRPGVRDQRDRRAAQQASGEILGALAFVVLVIADGRLLNPVVVEEFARLSRVLARDQVHLPEDAHGPVRDVLEIADRGRDEVEVARHVLSIGRSARLNTLLLCPKFPHAKTRKPFGISTAPPVQFPG
jgi:hypothetical protein